MPYTPPAQQSPASPTRARHYFESHHHGPQPSPHSPGPASRATLPRSRSSSFASKKRHDEELAKNTAANTQRDEGDKVEQALSIDTSVRQSPPPVTDAVMPAGALMSPPDSGHNSSDEDGSGKEVDNEATEGIKELEKAVRESLQINRKGSPDLDNSFQFPPRPDGEDSSTTLAPKLSNTAKKIAHSRSSTDSAILLSPQAQSFESSVNPSVSDGSEDEAEKPPLIRKKSGELVKPAIRPKNRRTASSMPGTPTYGKKGVHFNDDIQQVRHFLQVDRPIAVSAGGSPVEVFEEDGQFPFGRHPPSPSSAGFDIRLRNFPRESFERLSQPVRLDKLALSADQKSLVGYVVVANIAFHKHVVARFTFDSWKTTSEVLGEYNDEPLQKPKDGYDVFTFTINLADHKNIEKKTMFICMRYSVNGQDYWDNNRNSNFHVEFTRKQSQPSATAPLGTRPIPRSRRNSVSPARPHSMPSFEEDFARNFDSGPALKLKQPKKAPEVDPLQPRRSNPATQHFGVRYDFGASLTAALNQAQSSMGDRNAPRSRDGNGSPPEPPKHSISKLQRHSPPQMNGGENPRTEAIHANKSSLDSRAYQEFVSKFCFFGSGKPQTGTGAGSETRPTSHQAARPFDGSDGANDEPPLVPAKAPERAVPPAEASSGRPGRPDEQEGQMLSPRLLGRTGGSHSPSPAFGSPVGYGSRSSSPASLGYRFGQNSGLLSPGGTAPATAIQG